MKSDRKTGTDAKRGVAGARPERTAQQPSSRQQNEQNMQETTRGEDESNDNKSRRSNTEQSAVDGRCEALHGCWKAKQ